MAGIYNASAVRNKTAGKINNASLPDLQTFIQAGIDPKTGLPVKMVEEKNFKESNKKLLRIRDEQDAINSVTWYNLPNGLNGKLIERIIYYRGQGMFFYMEDVNQFFFLPYALDGTIDVYGRFTSVTPYPFHGSTTYDDKNELKPWIRGLTRKCVYDIIINELTIEDVLNSCVLLHDYSLQNSQTLIPRQQLNDPLLDIMADMIPFARTALLNGTGVSAMRVTSEDEYSNVLVASKSVNAAALAGHKWIPTVGQIDFQDLTGGDLATVDQFFLAMQSLDNYRLSLHGLDSGGLFEKQAQILESENRLNSEKASLTMQDRISQRQDFCDIVNSIWGLGIWCEVSEPANGMDNDADGSMYENDPQTVSYEGGGGNNGTDV